MRPNSPPDFLFWSCKTLHQAIRRRELTSSQLTEACLAQIESVNPVINAAVQVMGEEALRESAKYDREAAAGRFRGPFHGIPVSIKDSIDTAGIVTTGGTEGRRHYRPEEDATVVARLRKAGAVLLAKTNTPELTFSHETVNTIYGRTCNPYDISRSPGGSSGGAVALVAAGGSFLDLGSDTGGSIREPAHFCGVAGIKPTSGTVPLTGHVIPWGIGALSSLTQIGPIARSVGDLTMALPCIAGPDHADPGVIPVTWRDPASVEWNGLRIAWHHGNGIVTPDEDVCRVVRDAVRMTEKRGASLQEVRTPMWKELHDLLIELRECVLGDLVRDLLERYGTRNPGPGLAGYLTDQKCHGSGLLANTLLQRIEQARSQMLMLMRNHDAIICPPSVSAARPHDSGARKNHGMNYEQWSLVTIHNLLGWPCGVVRAGTSKDNELPIGVQVVSTPGREDVVLAVMEQIERDGGGYRPPVMALQQNPMEP